MEPLLDCAFSMELTLESHFFSELSHDFSKSRGALHLKKWARQENRGASDLTRLAYGGSAL